MIMIEQLYFAIFGKYAHEIVMYINDKNMHAYIDSPYTRNTQ